MIQAYPGKTGWNEAISQKIVWMVGASEQSATLTLNPKDLGPLQVVIQVNNEKADATFISENPEVRKGARRRDVAIATIHEPNRDRVRPSKC